MELKFLQDFTSKLANLVEVKIYFNSFKNYQDVEEFLDRHPQLMRAHFHSGSEIFLESYLRELLEPLANKWNIDVFNVSNGSYTISHFILDRKN